MTGISQPHIHNVLKGKKLFSLEVCDTILSELNIDLQVLLRAPEIQRQVIKAKNVPFNDLRKAFVEHWKKNNPDNKSSGILTYDGNHFNDAGMRFVAEQMLKGFK